MDYSVTKEKFNALKQGGADATATNGDDDDASTPPLDGSAEASGSEDEMDVDDDPEGEHTKGGDETSDDESEDDEEDEDEEGGPDAGAGVGRAQERQRTADVQQGCTIFVRNVAFDCRQEEVKDRFGEFGAVRLALLVTDRATGMPRGSAFVKVRGCFLCTFFFFFECMSTYLESVPLLVYDYRALSYFFGGGEGGYAVTVCVIASLFCLMCANRPEICYMEPQAMCPPPLDSTGVEMLMRREVCLRTNQGCPPKLLVER